MKIRRNTQRTGRTQQRSQRFDEPDFKCGIMMEEQNKIEIYQSPDNQTVVEVKFDEQTVWLNRHQLAILFNRDVKTIGKHINNVFKEGELEKEVVVAKFATTTQHGAIKGKTQTKEVEYYNLDVIISVGYRVKSKQGTQFRIWATQRLKEFGKMNF